VKEPAKIAARQAREERLRSALRENLKRRKAQSRGRESEPPDRSAGGAGPSEEDGENGDQA
jgi:hypothetical protein